MPDDVAALTAGAERDAPGRREGRGSPSGCRVRWLVDNAAAYDEVLRAIARARRSVWISQLAFDVDCRVYRTRRSTKPRTADEGVALLEALLAAPANGAIDVRILLNASLLLDTAAPLRAFLARRRATHVRVRGVSRFPQLLHAKILIVDDTEAFLLGSPFVNGYWDDTRHRPADARRPARELGGRPLHDVSVHITGPAVHGLRATFAELWDEGSVGAAEADVANRRPVAAHERHHDGPIRIVRTAPRGGLRQHPAGLSEILAAVEAGLAGARSLVYIEHQYLSARPVIAALVAALARAPALEVVILLNQNPDVTAYRGWQNARLREAGLLDHPRVGLFTPWSAESSDAPGTTWLLNQLFVHSKVLTVDDRWATVGSANLDGVSLHSYGDDFVGRLGRRVFRHVRNFDVNVVVDAGPRGLAGTVRSLRTQLWGEHLGLPTDLLESRPADGWLPLWRDRAARNVRALNGESGSVDAPTSAALVLPYSTRPTPIEQLRDVGVHWDPRRIDLRFNPGWLEVHCSPNWVRNMFA